jgi:hypothetical protein
VKHANEVALAYIACVAMLLILVRAGVIGDVGALGFAVGAWLAIVVLERRRR